MAVSPNTRTLPENGTTISDAWAIAAGRMSAAKSALNEYDRQIWRPAFQASENGGPDIPAHIMQEIERLQDEASEAEEVLFQLPAPDLVALLWKFERHRANVEGIFPCLDRTLDAIGADLTRLAQLEGIKP